MLQVCLQPVCLHKQEKFVGLCRFWGAAVSPEHSGLGADGLGQAEDGAGALGRQEGLLWDFNSLSPLAVSQLELGSELVTEKGLFGVFLSSTSQERWGTP